MQLRCGRSPTGAAFPIVRHCAYRSHHHAVAILPEHYAALARTIRRTDTIEVEELVAHLNTIGYTAMDVVEMPGNTPCAAA